MKLNGLLRRAEVCRLVGVSKSTLFRWIQDPKIAFPPRIRLSLRLSVWRVEDVKKWMGGLENAA